MPMYDFCCPRGHKFEANVKIADRSTPIPCEFEIEVAELGGVEGPPSDIVVTLDLDVSHAAPAKKPCGVLAKRVEIGHSNTKAMLDYGLRANHDAMREGRYNPDLPIRRGVRK